MKRRIDPLSTGQNLLWAGARQEVGHVDARGRRRNPETQVTADVRDWADRNPGRVRLVRTHCGDSWRDGRRLVHAPESWPDFTGGTWFGAAIAIECKREGEEATPEQAETLEALREFGWLVFVVRSAAELEREFAIECARCGHPIDFA